MRRFVQDHQAVTMASRQLPNVDYSAIKVGDVLTLTYCGLPMGTKTSGTLVRVLKITKKNIFCSNNIKVSREEGDLMGLADAKHGKAGYRLNA